MATAPIIQPTLLVQTQYRHIIDFSGSQAEAWKPESPSIKPLILIGEIARAAVPPVLTCRHHGLQEFLR